jgi:hypothetical protein
MLLGEFLADKGVSRHRGVPREKSGEGDRKRGAAVRLDPRRSRQIDEDRDCPKAGGYIYFH